jgi:hypothetical protein
VGAGAAGEGRQAVAVVWCAACALCLHACAEAEVQATPLTYFTVLGSGAECGALVRQVLNTASSMPLLRLQAKGAAPGLRRSLSCYSSCYLVLDLSANPWRVVHMNEPAREATGVQVTSVCLATNMRLC